VSVYTIYTEKQQSKGRVDCIVETPDYIFEFKLDGTSEEALAQIEEKVMPTLTKRTSASSSRSVLFF
jgi:hypothetical protein